MKVNPAKWHQWLLIIIAMAGIEGNGLTPVQAQQVPARANICTPSGRLLTDADRETVARVVRNRVKEKLGLTDQQAEQIQTILQSRRDEARADAQALCEARVELRQLLQQQNSDAVSLKAAADRVKTLQARFLDRRLEITMAVRSQMTADQWAKWIELRKTMDQRWKGWGNGIAF